MHFAEVFVKNLDILNANNIILFFFFEMWLHQNRSISGPGFLQGSCFFFPNFEEFLHSWGAGDDLKATY